MALSVNVEQFWLFLLVQVFLSHLTVQGSHSRDGINDIIDEK